MTVASARMGTSVVFRAPTRDTGLLSASRIAGRDAPTLIIGSTSSGRMVCKPSENDDWLGCSACGTVPARSDMFHLSYDAKHNVLLSSYSGTYGPEDIMLRDGAVRRFVAVYGLCHGIMDFSAVNCITVSLDLLIRRSHQPPILRGHQRVIVAPSDPALSFTRLIAAHQLYARKEEPLLVGSIREACCAIGISEPKFEPVPPDAAAKRERILHGVLREIDRATTDDRWKPFLLERPAQRARQIALTDLINVALGRSALREADARAWCPSCRQAFPMHHCPVLSGRTTTYLCPTCRAWMMSITSIAPTESAAAKGYVLGTFEVVTRTDLHIAGVRLPRNECS